MTPTDPARPASPRAPSMARRGRGWTPYEFRGSRGIRGFADREGLVPSRHLAGAFGDEIDADLEHDLQIVKRLYEGRGINVSEASNLCDDLEYVFCDVDGTYWVCLWGLLWTGTGERPQEAQQLKFSICFCVLGPRDRPRGGQEAQL